MGIRASWMGVRGASQAKTLARLGLRDTAETTVVAELEEELYSLNHPSGWFIVQGPEEFVTRAKLASVSAGGEAVGCVECETVMVSEALGYRDGAEVWSVLHDPERGEAHLAVEGEPPTVLTEICRRLTPQHESDTDGHVDYLFDAPIELTKSICGYSLDEMEPEVLDFSILEPVTVDPARTRQDRAALLPEPQIPQIEQALFPVVEALGFQRVTTRRDYMRDAGAQPDPNVLVRLRNDHWERLRFLTTWRGSTPVIEVFFFVQDRYFSRYGRDGRAFIASPQRSLRDRLLGRNRPPQETLDTALAKMKAVLVELDAYLKDGAPSPNIEPPVY